MVKNEPFLLDIDISSWNSNDLLKFIHENFTVEEIMNCEEGHQVWNEIKPFVRDNFTAFDIWSEAEIAGYGKGGSIDDRIRTHIRGEFDPFDIWSGPELEAHAKKHYGE